MTVPRLKPGVRAVLPALLLAAALALARGAYGQGITVEAKQASLEQVLEQLEPQTGYRFRMAVEDETEALRRDVSLKDAPLSRVLLELSKLYGCDFINDETRGFFAVPPGKQPAREVAVGDYRLKVFPPRPTVDSGTLELAVSLSAPDEERMEAIHGLAADLKVSDSFRRSLLADPGEGGWTTSRPRVRLTEYTHQLPLHPRDDRAARIRSMKGSLVLFRTVTPLKFEFPIADDGAVAEGSRMLEQRDVRMAVQRFGPLELVRRDDEGKDYTATVRQSWPRSAYLAGRGISRRVIPYLVDANGRVYRDPLQREVKLSTDQDARVEREQLFRFEGVEAKPARLVYELFLKEQPDRRIPFQVTDIPLPGRSAVPVLSPDHPFHAEKGGSVVAKVTDRGGAPVEGELSLALSRKTGAGWSPWRWVSVVTDARGEGRLLHVDPGVYRVRQVFRLDPLGTPSAQEPKPVEVTVTAGARAALPALKLPQAVSDE
ncbi:MAG: hypothetical protein ACK47B_02265 [Armatimonadota bacterium]